MTKFAFAVYAATGEEITRSVLLWDVETFKVFGFPTDRVPSVEKFLDGIHPYDLEFV